MSARTDAALTLLVLAAVLGAFVRTNGSVSPPLFVLGGLATLAFEVVAARDSATVREYWERTPVQVVAVVLALVGVMVGIWVASSGVLSTMAGALVTYLGFLAVIAVDRKRSK